MTSPSPITTRQLDRLYEAIDFAFPGDVHGGDVLDTVRDMASRHDIDTYWDLTFDEAEKVIAGLLGR